MLQVESELLKIYTKTANHDRPPDLPLVQTVLSLKQIAKVEFLTVSERCHFYSYMEPLWAKVLAGREENSDYDSCYAELVAVNSTVVKIVDARVAEEAEKRLVSGSRCC